MIKKYYRIHGDNIVECERTLDIICRAFGVNAILLPSPAYRPIYSLEKDGLVYEIELLSGHDRWGFSVGEEIISNGGILRENADSYFSLIEEGKEHILFAFEYCSALPAGNNAWQRNGRALSCVMANVPYFYFAELGGPELDENRNMKAPRYPNPIVPFSYISATMRNDSFCLPVYSAHPSITQQNFNIFQDIFGYETFLIIVKKMILGDDYSHEMNVLINKSLQLVKTLSANRRGHNTFVGDQWDDLLGSHNPAEWIINNTGGLRWSKKTASKVQVTVRFEELFNRTLALNCYTIGAKDIPICLLNYQQKLRFQQIVNSLYNGLDLSFNSKKPLAIIWITGFKPRGDDSRPDRGLTPLAKMVLGDSCEYLAVVYGPAKPFTWSIFERNPEELSKSNGLWEAIFNICDYVIADSVTSEYAYYHRTNHTSAIQNNSLIFNRINATVTYGEHDIDTVIHQMLSHNEEKGVYECLCNPPGGDWSGINFFEDGKIYRWTSLPRVSQSGAKRPDHIFQVINDGEPYFFSIESKGNASALETNIGINLKTYLTDLFACTPTSKKDELSDWRFYSGPWNNPRYTIYSVGAFIYTAEAEMRHQLIRGSLDAIIAIELGNITTIHVLDLTEQRKLLRCLNIGKLSTVKIQIH